MLCENLRFGRGEQAIEAAQHSQRQDNLAVLIALVRPSQQVADAPDEVGELGMGFGTHCIQQIISVSEVGERGFAPL